MKSFPTIRQTPFHDVLAISKTQTGLLMLSLQDLLFPPVPGAKRPVYWGTQGALLIPWELGGCGRRGVKMSGTRNK